MASLSCLSHQGLESLLHLCLVSSAPDLLMTHAEAREITVPGRLVPEALLCPGNSRAGENAVNNKKGSGCQTYVMEWCRAGIRREGWRILVYFYVVIFKLKKKKA